MQAPAPSFPRTCRNAAAAFPLRRSWRTAGRLDACGFHGWGWGWAMAACMMDTDVQSPWRAGVTNRRTGKAGG